MSLVALFLSSPLLSVLPVLTWGWPTVLVDEWPFAMFCCSCPIAWLALGCVLWLTKPLALSAPEGCSTLADLACSCAPRPFRIADDDQHAVTEDYVWTRIQAIIADVTGVEPDRVTKEARLAEDLGLG